MAAPVAQRVSHNIAKLDLKDIARSGNALSSPTADMFTASVFSLPCLVRAAVEERRRVKDIQGN